MSDKLKDFDLNVVGTKDDDGGVEPASLTWITTSSGPCLEATVSLFTATPQLTTGSNYTENSDC